MSAEALYKGGSHASGNDIPVIVDDTREIRVEGDEYKICEEAFNSPEVITIENVTNKEALDYIHQQFACKFKQNEASSGDFIICKRVVKDDTRKTRHGTVKQILNDMQGEGGCKVEFAKGGTIKPQTMEKLFIDGGTITFEKYIAPVKGKLTNDIISIIQAQYKTGRVPEVKYLLDVAHRIQQTDAAEKLTTAHVVEAINLIMLDQREMPLFTEKDVKVLLGLAEPKQFIATRRMDLGLLDTADASTVQDAIRTTTELKNLGTRIVSIFQEYYGKLIGQESSDELVESICKRRKDLSVYRVTGRNLIDGFPELDFHFFFTYPHEKEFIEARIVHALGNAGAGNFAPSEDIVNMLYFSFGGKRFVLLDNDVEFKVDCVDDHLYLDQVDYDRGDLPTVCGRVIKLAKEYLDGKIQGTPAAVIPEGESLTTGVHEKMLEAIYALENEIPAHIAEARILKQQGKTEVYGVILSNIDSMRFSKWLANGNGKAPNTISAAERTQQVVDWAKERNAEYQVKTYPDSARDASGKLQVATVSYLEEGGTTGKEIEIFLPTPQNKIYSHFSKNKEPIYRVGQKVFTSFNGIAYQATIDRVWLQDKSISKPEKETDWGYKWMYSFSDAPQRVQVSAFYEDELFSSMEEMRSKVRHYTTTLDDDDDKQNGGMAQGGKPHVSYEEFKESINSGLGKGMTEEKIQFYYKQHLEVKPKYHVGQKFNDGATIVEITEVDVSLPGRAVMPKEYSDLFISYKFKSNDYQWNTIMETEDGLTQLIENRELIPVKEDGGMAQGGNPATRNPQPATNYYHGTAYHYDNPFTLNKAIEEFITTVKGNSKNPADYSGAEKQFIAQYTGMGGLIKEGAEGKGILYEFYTPDDIVKKMWALAYKHGFSSDGNVCENAAGIGRFLRYLPRKTNGICTAFETNPISATICQVLYPQVNVRNESFETLFIRNNDTVRKTVDKKRQIYDLVITNPPYGEYKSRFSGMGERDFTKATTWVEYFIFRGLDILKPGGLLCYIIGTEVAVGGIPFLAKGTNNCKKVIAEKAELLEAYRLPNGVFERTDVLTDIILLRKK